MDVTFVLSAIIFTLLAIVVATSLLNGSSPAAANARSYFGHRGDAGGLAQNGHVPDKKKKKKEQREPDDWSDISGSSHDHWDVVKSVLSTEGATESPGINDAVDSNDSNSLKYVPGKARSHHLEMMMSKDELEEEQRVQREQLAAIFQLLKDNKETFGDVSEGDMEEQLRLYSI
ncbi:matrix-remodeling-associated protein 7-like isoform X2 [Acanthochromis polyacanthus]|uniref:Matrix-remodeling-associated protein 7-like n=1 Tax=Acanthochromis polyacanthus TaxID=80966 RepID=A0A3Q1GVM6_9TELE|nr:matrix-remodeling-associated protein 7-like isoform X2 [Acanthochromis polyacanthus]